MNLPADVGQQALDAAGIDFTIGDLEEGTRPAQVLLRAYGQCLRQLLRAAPWDFARKQVPLICIGDMTGQTPNVSTVVPIPWVYEYRYPSDCMKMRFIPFNYPPNTPVPTGNIQIPSTPLTTGSGPQWTAGYRLRPSRFLLTTDPNVVPPPGSQFWQVQGESPQGSLVVLSNVQNAVGIYTGLMQFPSLWDSQFRAAFVSYLASEIALPLAKMSVVTPAKALELRKDNIAIARDKIKAARVTDGNEGFYSSDLRVDWMDYRRVGGWGAGRGGWGDTGQGPGMWFGGYDSISFADGSAY